MVALITGALLIGAAINILISIRHTRIGVDNFRLEEPQRIQGGVVIVINGSLINESDEPCSVDSLWVRSNELEPNGIYWTINVPVKGLKFPLILSPKSTVTFSGRIELREIPRNIAELVCYPAEGDRPTRGAIATE